MNKSTLINFLMFTAGAAIGSVVIWKLIDEKYKKLAHDEIEEVRKYYKSKVTPETKEKPTEIDGSTTVAGQIDLVEYAEMLNEHGYTNYTNDEIKEMSSVKRPYVIKPEEFGEIDYYDTETLYYYADGVLTDDGGNPIEDVDGMVGLDSLDHFGDYEDDSVHVRNDAKKTDYEILRDLGNYSDDADYDPHSAEDE